MADTHFTPTRRTKTYADLVARFWSKVGPPDENGCRPWLGGKSRGYGHFSLNWPKVVKAHAFAWRLTYHGPTMPGAVFRHECDNPWCVTPEHITPGTLADNVVDRDTRGRTGHPTGPRPAGRRPKPAGFGATRRGAKNPSAKLSASAVLAIRKARASGRTLENVASAFGVTTTTVWRICRKTPHGGWAWLDGSHL